MVPEPSTFAKLVNPNLRDPEVYVPGLTRVEAARRYRIPPEEIIKMSSNENPLGPPPLAVKAVETMMGELHRYPDSKAHTLREAIAMREGVSWENVLCGAGSSEIMSFIIRAFSGPGDEVISMHPSFSVYSELAKADGRTPVLVRLSHPFELGLKDVARVLTDRTRVLFMTRPNNPTSRLIPLDLLEQIAELAKSAVVVSEEAYIEFAEDYRKQTAVDAVLRHKNMIVTRTFSKAYGLSSLRIGYALAPRDAIEYLLRVKPKWNVGGVAQEAAIGALADTAHFQKSLDVVREGRQFLADAFSAMEGMEVLPAPQGNFIMVKVSDTGLDAEAFTAALGKQGILIRGDFLKEYVRISVGTMPENEKLVAAAKRILRPLHP
jgi:histidinol-phosphate aminotransferase